MRPSDRRFRREAARRWDRFPTARRHRQSWALRYSWRSALIGSIRLARRAGRKLANSAAATRMGIMMAKVDGSVVPMPSTRCTKRRPAAKAASMPTPMPGERAARQLFHGTNLVKSLIACSTAQFPPQWFDRIQWRAAGPDGNRHEFGPTTQQRVWHLGKGIIELCAHLSLIVAGQTPMPHMAHYPHHPDGVGAHLWDPEALPDRLLSAEGVLRQNVINHYDELFAHAIVVIEESALAQRDSHDL